MSADLWIKLVGLVVAGLTGVFAAATYHRNSRTKAAEFMVGLHRMFFVDATYQGMKALLDCDGPAEEAKLAEAVAKESAEFTDFLNLFELVAYLTQDGTLDAEDTEALFGYYLDRLRGKAAVWEYVRQSSKGFENLRRLLVERAAG